LAVTLVLTARCCAETRTWTDKTGKFSTEAEFVSVENGFVKLKKTNGKTIKLELEKLSQADREFIESLSAAEATDDAPAPAADSEANTTPDEITDPDIPPRPQNGGLINNVRAAPLRNESIQKIRQICIALTNYESTHGRFPTAAMKTSSGTGLSWRVAILPFLEEETLYRRFRLNEPWDSPHNKKLISRMPDAFMSPGGAEVRGWTNYLAVVGDNTIIVNADKGVRTTDIKDGMSHTIVIVEADDTKAAIWTKPDDFTWNPDRPTVGLGGIWPGYFLAGFVGDAAARRIHLDSNEQINALFTRNGRERVTLDE
jgi:hypothetical protein